MGMTGIDGLHAEIGRSTEMMAQAITWATFLLFDSFHYHFDIQTAGAAWDIQ